MPGAMWRDARGFPGIAALSLGYTANCRRWRRDEMRKSLSERALGFALLSPAAALLLLIVVYPIAQLVWNSFFDIHLAEPWRGEPFVGIDNYRRAFEDNRFWSSLWHTVIYAVV